MAHIITKIMYTGLVIASTHLYADNYNFKPGLWETSSSQEIIELDAPPEVKKMMQSMFKMPVETETECIKSIDFLLDPESDEMEECNVNMNRVNANKVMLEVSCENANGSSKTVGELILNGDTFTSNLKVEASDNAMKMNVKMKLVGNGTYIGDCK